MLALAAAVAAFVDEKHWALWTRVAVLFAAITLMLMSGLPGRCNDLGDDAAFADE